MFKISEYSDEVQKLYNEIDNELNNNLEVEIVDMQNAGGKFYQTTDGKYIIQINKNYQNDFVLSHELLHIYISIHQILPSIVRFDNTRDNVCEPIAIMLNSLIDHKYIYERQAEMGIEGYNNHIDTRYESIISLSKSISENMDENFRIITELVTFFGDIDTCILSKSKEDYYMGIEKSMPEIYNIAIDIVKLYSDKKLNTPYYIRKSISRILDRFIEIINYDISFVKYSINILLSVRENQLHMPASTILTLLRCKQNSYFATKQDKQSICNIRMIIPLGEIPIRRKKLDDVTLGKILEMYKIEHFIDDRCNDWRLIQYDD